MLSLSADNLMLQIVSPRIWLPSMQITWGVLTFCTSVVHDVRKVAYLVCFVESCHLTFPNTTPDVRHQVFSGYGGSIYICRHALYSGVVCSTRSP